MKTPNTTAFLSRLKSSYPFSANLNRLILSSFADIFLMKGAIKVKFVDYEPYGSFEAMKADITDNNRLLISRLHSDNTIFGSELTNTAFRAVHDYLHFTLNLDFSHESELIVNYYQDNIFRNLGATRFDLDLLNIETAGQVVYHKATGDFPKDQRQFAISELQKIGY